MTRFQTYQITEPDENGKYNCMTIDTNTEQPPTEFVAGPFNVNMTEAEMIEEGATIEVVDDDVSVYFEGEVS